MKFLILFLFINNGLNGYSQIVRDSLLYVEQQLNLEFLIQTKELYEDKYDFVMVRVNDSLSYENNSYHYYYNIDSCTHGGAISFDTNRVQNGSKYQLLYGSIGFAYANGDYSCVNSLTPEDDMVKMTSNLKKEEVYVRYSDLNLYEYILYGRIGDKYIYEIFSREYANSPENKKFLEFVSLFCDLYSVKTE